MADSCQHNHCRLSAADFLTDQGRSQSVSCDSTPSARLPERDGNRLPRESSSWHSGRSGSIPWLVYVAIQSSALWILIHYLTSLPPGTAQSKQGAFKINVRIRLATAKWDKHRNTSNRFVTQALPVSHPSSPAPRHCRTVWPAWNGCGP